MEQTRQYHKVVACGMCEREDDIGLCCFRNRTVELMSTEVCGIADGNQMRIKMCVVFLLF